MNLLLRRIRAFIIRDFQLALSYHVEFFIKIIWILGIVTTFFFISRIFAGFPLAQYEQWQNPLAAWLTGLAMLNYFLVGIFQSCQRDSAGTDAGNFGKRSAHADKRADGGCVEFGLVICRSDV